MATHLRLIWFISRAMLLQAVRLPSTTTRIRIGITTVTSLHSADVFSQPPAGHITSFGRIMSLVQVRLTAPISTMKTGRIMR